MAAPAARAATSSTAVFGPSLSAGASPTPGQATPAATQSGVDSSLEQTTGLTPAQVTASDVCSAPALGHAQCDAQVLRLSSTGAAVHPSTSAAPALATASTAPAPPPQATTPAYLQQAYDLTYLSQTAGSGDTVGIVDAYNDPTAASDLATFRSHFGLPACTEASGCLQIVNQNGQTSPLPANSPSGDNWEEEESLDLDAVSSLCPNCHIILVETNDDYTSDLDAGITAAASLGANQISNSWSANLTSAQSDPTPAGVTLIAATGDHGYPGAGTDAYPAAEPGYTAAGGTTLTAASGLRGFGESAWSLASGWGGTSGCDLNEAKPAWQTDTGCTGRSYSDVSADANPDTGLTIYDSGDGGWLLMGGTSLASPLIAAYDALTNVDPTGARPQWPYADESLLNDPASGTSGTCASNISYICNAGPGYDGPTGAGSISGDVAPGAPGIGSITASPVASTGATLTAGVYPNSLDTTYYVEYGTSTSFGSQTPSAGAGAGTALTSASATLTGLSPSTTYYYRLVATNSDGTAYGYYSSFTTPQSSNPPVSTGTPTVTGTTSTGDVLTVNSSWNPPGQSYAYAWQRSTDSGSTWQTISGATDQTYSPTTADEGALIRATVTATNQYGSASATSQAVGPVTSNPPVNTAPPTVTGITQRTYTLTATGGTWTGPNLTYSFQWQSSPDGTSWTDIPGATAASYTLGQSDEGEFLRVAVSAANPDGIVTAASSPTLLISPYPPANVDAPALSGTPERTYTLTADKGTWTGPDNAYTYRWQRDFGEGYVDIPGATSATYTLQKGDEGSVVRVVVTATNPDGVIQQASQPTTTVQDALPISETAPTLAGTAQRSSTLSVVNGTWGGESNTYSFQWQRSSDQNTWTDIPGATAPTHLITTGDEGYALRAVVTATNPDGSASADTAATAVITPAPPLNTTAPTLSGTATRGLTLTADPGTWSGIGNTYAYQWQRSSDQTTWTDISGATAPSYTLTTADEGDTVRMEVIATNPDATLTTATPASATVTASAPVASTAPSVTGTPQRAVTLNAAAGTWSGIGNSYAYQWQSSTDGGTTWTDIAKATGLTYTLTAGDEGAEVRFQATATNPDGTVTADSVPTATVAAAPPVATSTPTISGTAQRGETLTLNPGGWTGAGNTYAYQWQRSSDGSTWTDISGATATTYTLAAADEGDTVRAMVTATNPDATVSDPTSASGTVASAAPVNTAAPSVTGTATRGDTLTATQGTWNGLDNTYAYQWQSSTDNGSTWTNIAQATGSTYTPGVADEGAELRFTVTASNVDGSVTASSGGTPAVRAAPPVATAAPAITGDAVRSSTLSAGQGTWTGVGNTYAYQWQRNTGSGFTDITGATGPAYTVTTADENATLRVVVTATNADATVTSASAATGTVPPAPPTNSAAPTVSGTAQRASTLTATQGTWGGIGNSYAYQWQRSADGGATWTAIVGATGATYTLALADEGDEVRVLVTATNPDGTLAVASDPTAAVAAVPPVHTALPSVSGTAQRAMMLTGTAGTWTGVGNSLTYQWQSSPDGSTWTDIHGATASTYTLTAGDEGNQIRLEVTATNPDATVTADSAPTGAVASDPPVNTALPTLSGAARRASTLASSLGLWQGAGNTYTYQWQRSADNGATWTDVTGATSATYLLGTSDEGDELRVVVAAANPDATVTADSAPTDAVAADPPVNITAPGLTGTAQRGETLSASPGVWSGSGDTYAYQWQHSTDGITWTDISGATQPTHQLGAADEGDNIRVVVTATNADAAVSAPSRPTVTVTKSPPVDTTIPGVSGDARKGAQLTATTGLWNGPGNSYAYQWQHSSDGATWTNITGATNATYTLTSGDVSDTVRVAVTATNVDGSATADSAATQTVMAPPNNTTAPAAPTGTLENTYTLTADPGAWDATSSFSYAWERCAATAAGIDSSCTQVGTGATHVVANGDVGSRLGVVVTATDAGGSATAHSALTAVITGRPLSNLGAPSISGDPQVPSTLTANAGTWSVPLSGETYAWERCGADGKTGCGQVGTGSTYQLTAADAGSTIVLVATAASPGQTATAQSLPLTVENQPVPQPSQNPTLSGLTSRLDWLTVSAGQWSNSPTSITYQWQRCNASGQSCQDITGQTTNQYQLTKADEGSTITAVVSATNASGTGHATAPVSAIISADPPVNTSPPHLQNGGNQQGAEMAIVGGSWNATGDTTYAYQWARCDASGASCVDIAGATGADYWPVAADVGHELSGRVIASNPDGSVAAPAGTSGPVQIAAPRWKTLPTISHDPGHVGDTVTATPGVWTGPTVATDTVDMMRCTSSCQPISGFSGTSYTISSGDLGAVLRVRETASNAGGSVAVWSAWYVGPVSSAAAGSGVLGGRGQVAVRNASGQPLAFVELAQSSVMHTAMARANRRGLRAGVRRVWLRRAQGVSGPLHAWVCPAAQPRDRAPAPCTRKVVFRGASRMLTVPARMTGRLRVVVIAPGHHPSARGAAGASRVRRPRPATRRGPAARRGTAGSRRSGATR